MLISSFARYFGSRHLASQSFSLVLRHQFCNECKNNSISFAKTKEAELCKKTFFGCWTEIKWRGLNKLSPGNANAFDICHSEKALKFPCPFPLVIIKQLWRFFHPFSIVSLMKSDGLKSPKRLMRGHWNLLQGV